MAGFVEDYAFQMLNKSDLNHGKEWMRASCVYLCSVRGQNLKHSFHSWGLKYSAVYTNGSGTCGIVSRLIAFRVLSVPPSAATLVHQVVRSVDRKLGGHRRGWNASIAIWCDERWSNDVSN